MTNKVTRQEYIKNLAQSLRKGTADEQTDNQGQVIIYTGVYLWADGSLRSEADPERCTDSCKGPED